jgi:hypothetical protein
MLIVVEQHHVEERGDLVLLLFPDAGGGADARHRCFS